MTPPSAGKASTAVLPSVSCSVLKNKVQDRTRKKKRCRI